MDDFPSRFPASYHVPFEATRTSRLLCTTFRYLSSAGVVPQSIFFLPCLKGSRVRLSALRGSHSANVTELFVVPTTPNAVLHSLPVRVQTEISCLSLFLFHFSSSSAVAVFTPLGWSILTRAIDNRRPRLTDSRLL